MARIVLATYGSLGDLHPNIALALGLKARGHDPVLAGAAGYREKIEALGLAFKAVRPDNPDVDNHPERMAQFFHPRKGPERLIRGLMMPALRDSYTDLLAVARGADLLVSHPLTFAVRLVAEEHNIPWASVLLQPLGFFSALDPSVFPQAPWLSSQRYLGPLFVRVAFRLGRRIVAKWCEEWHQLRAELGLPETDENPILEGQHSPALVLALFSNHFAAKQTDWPPQAVQPGFVYFDKHGAPGMPAELERFLQAGPPPIVFTLGSAAVMDAGEFYEHSAAAAKALKRRAVLLIGSDARNRKATLPDGVAAFEYAPYSELFPRAAAVVHSCGAGTTAQCLRAGVPALAVPFAFDQPDNASRLARLGVARVVARKKYNAARAAAALKELLDNPGYKQKAAALGEKIRQEDGVGGACAAIERLLASK